VVAPLKDAEVVDDVCAAVASALLVVDLVLRLLFFPIFFHVTHSDASVIVLS
jgi:hypothetical protein